VPTEIKSAAIDEIERKSNSQLFDQFVGKRINEVIRTVVFKYKNKIKALKHELTEQSKREQIIREQIENEHLDLISEIIEAYEIDIRELVEEVRSRPGNRKWILPTSPEWIILPGDLKFPTRHYLKKPAVTPKPVVEQSHVEQIPVIEKKPVIDKKPSFEQKFGVEQKPGVVPVVVLKPAVVQKLVVQQKPVVEQKHHVEHNHAPKIIHENPKPLTILQRQPKLLAQVSNNTKENAYPPVALKPPEYHPSHVGNPANRGDNVHRDRRKKSSTNYLNTYNNAPYI